MNDFEEARDKTLMAGGAKSKIHPGRGEAVWSLFMKRGTAPALFPENADSLHKITFSPGMAGPRCGFSLPEDDSYSRNKAAWIDRITIAMGDTPLRRSCLMKRHRRPERSRTGH